MASIKTNKPKTNRKSKTAMSALPLKKGIKFNKWMALGTVAILAGVGIYTIKQSSASNYTFVLDANARELRGGTVQNKSGTPYRVPNRGTSVHVLSLDGQISLALPAGTKSVCAHIKAIGAGSYFIQGGFDVNRYATYKNSITLADGQTGNVCIGVISGAKRFAVGIGPTSTNDTISVSSIYGLAY